MNPKSPSRFKTKYGYFTPEGNEYVITTPYTPRPWSNILTNGRYYSLCLHTGRGFSLYKNPLHCGITRWGCTLQESLMRYVYVKDGNDVWTLNWEPVQKPFKSWECRTGFGYTTITSERGGVKGSITYTVPVDRDAEDWIITLKNTSEKKKNLRIFTGVEPQLGDMTGDLVTTRFKDLFLRLREKNKVLYAASVIVSTDDPSLDKRSEWAREIYFGATPQPQSFDLEHKSFMGNHRNASSPVAVERGYCSNSKNVGRQPVFAFHWNVSLKPGEEKRIVVSLGVQRKGSQYKPISYKTAINDLGKTKKYWNGYLEKGLTVETPDPVMNLTVNKWNKYQCRINFWWYSASVSFYRFGGGIWGFRDSSQAVLGNNAVTPALSKKRLLEIGSHIFSTGRAVHLFSQEYYDYGKERPSPHPDIVFWWVLSLFDYIKETGNFSVLDSIIPYQDKGKGTVYEHIKRVLDYACKNTGQKGLVLFEEGDWNDGMNFVGCKGKGVSIMATQVLVYILEEWSHLNRLMKKEAVSNKTEKMTSQFKRNLNRFAWDGNYFVRAFDDRGKVLGSKHNREGKIYLNSQSWAVIASITSEAKLKKSMDSVHKYLYTDAGNMLFWPPYTKPDNNIGIITRFLPGEKENSAIFQHAASWSIIAAALLGEGNKALQYYLASNPVWSGRDPDRFECEPYVYGEYVTGPDSPHFGQGSHSWFTGAVPWMFRAATDYILGIRPEYNGLRINPCIPGHWKGFSAKRKFRGSTYKIKVVNKTGFGQGVKKMFINGKETEGNLIPASNNKKSSRVEVIL